MLGSDTAGTACTRGSVRLMLPVVAAFCAFSAARNPSDRSVYLGREHEMYTPEYTRSVYASLY